ncbi:hypothetical protein JDV02_003399 [Purpureocillium takamizusanense]|uniref:Major facilitator superfamily (MFS) profile domain-containing protein n=1 Tax=Purpureocillium takamizusanense TaxID=2060973 RepID=A0A9Q8QAJ2_9HYPO|nr:uncharacterized protein JDV02_003399 [Purpureocillium takamizusanense]UNI17019.1 hypothetical protein JDV02_003399 [Purpureocillium takamizusanense]
MGQPTEARQPQTGDMADEIDRLDDAADANAQEHELSLSQALRLHPKAVLWSIAMSTGVVMDGYDYKLVGTLYAQPAFQRAYGTHVKGNSYQISAPWQTGLSNGSAGGQLVGLLLAGYLSERFGFRKTTIAGLAVVVAFIFITFFAPNIIVLTVGQTVFGFPLGLFQTVPVVYALEIAPLCLRPYLTNYINSCYVIGQILATGILRGTLNIENQWAYRIPFAVQWVWPVILIPLVFMAPESPWWLVRRGRLDEAKKVLQRLKSPQNTNFDINKNVAMMVATTEHERIVNSQTSYWACFQGTNLKRTLIVIGIYCIQTLNGNPLRSYSTYFFQQAGLPTTQAFNLGVIGYCVALVGGIVSWVMLPFFGRRTIYLWSLVLMLIIMVLVGGIGVAQARSTNPSYSWAIGTLIITSSFLYNCSIGPLTNTLCGELPSTLLRSKSVVLARWTYIVTHIVAGFLTPYQLNPTAWNWSAKTGFFWAGGCLISVVFTFFCVPEPRDRTPAELDILFETSVPPRYFSKTAVDVSATLFEREAKTV